MPQRDYVATGVKVKQKSVFNLDELYSVLWHWFETHNYDFQEQEYRDETTAGGHNIEIGWYAERKIDDYIKFVLEITFFVVGYQKVEIEKEGGVKEKTGKGEVEIQISAYLLKDFEDRWGKPAVLLFLREVYDKFIIRGRIESLEGGLHDELYRFIDEIKAFLNLYRF